MGCDYYHEGPTETDDYNDPVRSTEPGELEFVFTIYDGDSNQVEEKRVSMEVPVNGKVYIDRLPERPPIWAR